jgi:hypothetical protein
MTTSQPLSQLEQEIFDYLNDTPNARQARIETLAARISYELDVRYSEALVIVEKWMETRKHTSKKIEQ